MFPHLTVCACATDVSTDLAGGVAAISPAATATIRSHGPGAGAGELLTSSCSCRRRMGLAADVHHETVETVAVCSLPPDVNTHASILRLY